MSMNDKPEDPFVGAWDGGRENSNAGLRRPGGMLLVVNEGETWRLLPRAPVLVRTWHPGSLPSSRVLNADDEPRLTRSEGDKVIASPRLRNASVLPPHPILPTIVRRQYARRIV